MEIGWPGDPISNRRCSESGSESVKLATGLTERREQSLCGAKATEPTNKLQLRKDNLRLGTWNVRGLLKPGKLNLLERELMRQNLDICGISETHWQDNGHFNTENHRIFISGAEKRGRNGVAILVNKKLVPYIYAYEAIHDRAMKISIAGKPHNLHIIQVYLPTGDAHEEEIEAIYASIDTIIQAIPSKESLLVIGDFNAKVGNNYCDHLKGTVGRYGLGERNERGERLIQFALDHSLAITNEMKFEMK
jgi:hypothetical protein